jgi:hypothetical protein
MCKWKLKIPQGKRKREKVAPERHIKDSPRARGVGPDDDDLLEVGPTTWQDVVEMANAGGRAINLEMQANKRKAQKIVKEGGHHVVDEMTAAGCNCGRSIMSSLMIYSDKVFWMKTGSRCLLLRVMRTEGEVVLCRVNSGREVFSACASHFDLPFLRPDLCAGCFMGRLRS